MGDSEEGTPKAKFHSKGNAYRCLQGKGFYKDPKVIKSFASSFYMPKIIDSTFFHEKGIKEKRGKKKKEIKPLYLTSN